jgi:hypothetical protein
MSSASSELTSSLSCASCASVQPVPLILPEWRLSRRWGVWGWKCGRRACGRRTAWQPGCWQGCAAACEWRPSGQDEGGEGAQAVFQGARPHALGGRRKRAAQEPPRLFVGIGGHPARGSGGRPRGWATGWKASGRAPSARRGVLNPPPAASVASQGAQRRGAQRGR